MTKQFEAQYQRLSSEQQESFFSEIVKNNLNREMSAISEGTSVRVYESLEEKGIQPVYT